MKFRKVGSYLPSASLVRDEIEAIIASVPTHFTAPVPTPRVDPTGIKLDDGYRTLVTFAFDTNIEFWEKTVTPPGYDGGDAIDTTTMHNDTYRTMSPRSLKTLTEFEMTAAYDPSLYTAALALINRETTITVTFPDGSTLAFYGFLKGFEAGTLEEGTQPEVTLTVVPTNQDPTTGAEEAPVLASVAGT